MPQGKTRDGRRGAAILAIALLLLAAVVDGWGWWRIHDLDVAEAVRRTPAGGLVQTALGADGRRASITVAVDASYPPFASVGPDGRLAGFEVELARELGNRLADRTEIVNMDAGDGLYGALAANRIDAIIAGIRFQPEVARDVAFSQSYFEAGPVVLVRADRADIQLPEDLSGKRVAVESGSRGEEEARRLKERLQGMELRSTDDVEQLVEAVASGSDDAAILEKSSIPFGSPSLARLRTLSPPLASDGYMVALRRKDAGLFLAINRELDSMKANGDLDRLERDNLR